MFGSRKTNLRRAEIRRNRPDTVGRWWGQVRTSGELGSLLIASGFCVVVALILMLRQEVVPYRPGQYLLQPVHARVNFAFHDKEQLLRAQREARDSEPRVYKSNGPVWQALEQRLKDLPDLVSDKSAPELPAPLDQVLDAGSITALRQYRAADKRPAYNQAVEGYVRSLDKLVILPETQRNEELKLQQDLGLLAPRAIRLPSRDLAPLAATLAAVPNRELSQAIQKAAFESFREELQPKVVSYTLATLQPTHVRDDDATTDAQNLASQLVPRSHGDMHYKANQIIVPAGTRLDDRHWQLLKAEHEQFIADLGTIRLVQSKMGSVGIAILLTGILAVYVQRYQPRVVRNHARGIGIAVLLASMLLVAQLAGMGTGPLYLFGLAPTVLVAMILSIAYDRRFAAGVATIHAVLVTAAVDQDVGFFLILFTGALTCCLLLDEIRTRSKLVEVGGAAAVAMMVATATVSATSLDPFQPLPFIGQACLYAGAAGLSVGFLVLGILPFIEKAFRITTSMTLLELADASQPLLRRLSMEAPGTYNHSLQVATLAEAAAEAIGCNSLLCRLGSYYHDIGKINKADYFCENQIDGRNRHLSLSPSVSLLIIIGHVKDGVEMAKEYNLPTSLFPFIQQHHGTTLVEYFYHQACMQRQQPPRDGSATAATEPPSPAISEMQYRYPGPKPRSRETAIVMICDAVESATRAMEEPTAARVESLVHELIMKRLLDGQFDECELTIRELALIERACVKTLLGIHHGRIAYPSTAAQTQAAAVPAVSAVRSA